MGRRIKEEIFDGLKTIKRCFSKKSKVKTSISKLKNDLDTLNIEELLDKSSYIQNLHVNLLKELEDKSAVWSHRFPLKDEKKDCFNSDNWNLPKSTVKTIAEYNQDLLQYADIICSLYNPFAHPDTPFDKEILPPWIVFPMYDGFTIGWRMGIGESYMETYIAFIESLSNDENEKYCNKYPEPEYLSTNSFGLNVINYNLRKEH